MPPTQQENLSSESDKLFNKYTKVNEDLKE